MSRFAPPTVRVLALDSFIATPGHSARPGEIVEVQTHVANTLIGMGKARLLTAEDHAPEMIQARDPAPIHRDPLPHSSRSKRK